MFDANGHWYCFGCGQGGDAVSFYASLRGLSQGEAARGLALQFGIAETEGEISAPYVPAPPTPATVLMRMATDWHKREWHRACTLRNKAAALIEREARKCSSAMSPGVALAESPEFWVWLAARSCAECRLDVLQDANAKDLLSMMREEDNEFEESDC